MEGGCSIPSFALAQLAADGSLTLHGGIISLSGEELVAETLSTPTAAGAETLGVQVAESVLSRGGTQILASIRQHRG